MNIKKIVSIIGLGIGLSLTATPALSAFSGGDWKFQDDDIDFLMDGTTLELKAPDGTGNTINVGDLLTAVFEMQTFTINLENAIPPGKEVTGISVIELITKDANGDFIEDDWIFAPTAGGIDTVLDSILGAGSAAARLGTNAGEGSMVAMFINDAIDPDPAVLDRDLDFDAAANPASNCVSLFDCVNEVTLGSLLQVDGFMGDPDEFWAADILNLPGGGLLPGDDIDFVHSLNEGIQVTNINFGLSTLFNVVEPVLPQNIFGTTVGCSSGIAADGCVHVRGNANVLGGAGLVNGAFAHSDLDANKKVPEPSAIMLLGVGLLGLGAKSLRRKA